MDLIRNHMISPDYTLFFANKVVKSSICANISSEDMNIYVYYLGIDFKLSKFIFEGSRYIFNVRCVSENRVDNYSLWYNGGSGKPILEDDSNLEYCYGYLSFLGQRTLCISKRKKEILKIKVKTTDKNDTFVCKNEIVAELFPCSALNQLTMQNSDCLQIMVKDKSIFDMRILLLYTIWKIIDKMDIYSCGI